MTSRSGQSQSGFTLLEVLVALVVLALLVLGLAQGLRFGVAAWDRQGRVIDRQEDLDAVDRTLRQLIEQINPGTAHDAPEIHGNASSVEFTSDLPEGAAAALPSREAEIRLLVDDRHRLVLRWAPYTHAIRSGPQPAVTDILLLPQVDHIVLSYWSRSGTAGWRSVWTKTEVPALIRLRVILTPESGPSWPDIVAAPQRGRP